MISLAYILLTITILSAIYFGYKTVLIKGGNSVAVSNKKALLVLLGLLGWVIYTSIISYSGILHDFSLPPKMPILLIFPAFAFTAYFMIKYHNHPLLKVLPKSWPIYYQSFRIGVELLILRLYLDGIGPISLTFEGYNYEILAGIAAPILAFLTFQLKVLPEKVIYYWNFVGLALLAIIVGLFITNAYFPSIWGAEQSLISTEIAGMPFILIPSLYMPSAVFMHILSIVQLHKSKK